MALLVQSEYTGSLDPGMFKIIAKFEIKPKRLLIGSLKRWTITGFSSIMFFIPQLLGTSTSSEMLSTHSSGSDKTVFCRPFVCFYDTSEERKVKLLKFNAFSVLSNAPLSVKKLNWQAFIGRSNWRKWWMWKSWMKKPPRWLEEWWFWELPQNTSTCRSASSKWKEEK